MTGKGLDEILTESDVETAVRKGYVEVLQKRFPGVPVRPVKGAARTFHMILLAAGMSTRFGSNKLLYPIDGRPMYRIGADRLLEIVRKGALRSDLTVVTQYPEIVDGLKDTGADVVINPDPARGISSSLQCGLRHLIKDQDVVGISMGSTLHQVVTEMEECRDKKITLGCWLNVSDYEHFIRTAKKEEKP